MKIKKSQLRRIIREVIGEDPAEITDPNVSFMLADALDKFGDAAAVLVEMGIDYERNSPENLHLMFQRHLDDNARLPTPQILSTWLTVRGMSGAEEDLEALLRGSY